MRFTLACSVKKSFALIFALGAILGGGALGNANAAGSHVLWQIGKADRGNAEFALAPANAQKFTDDGLYVVGQSESREDWPYVQPGPADQWAGNRAHTFGIIFGLKEYQSDGQCQLRLMLLDTHSSSPPRLQIQINGQAFEKTLPPGNGDESIAGDPIKGRPHIVEVGFASKLLRVGENEIQIKTIAGSWLLYDAIQLDVPDGVELAKVGARTMVFGVETRRALKEKNGKLMQPLAMRVRRFGDDLECQVRIEGEKPFPLLLRAGLTNIEMLLPAVTKESMRSIVLEDRLGQRMDAQSVTLKPVPKLTVYVLPHSHTDIGYTEIQSAVAEHQVNNLLKGIEFARLTSTNPPGARFVWNVEVLWAADLFMRQMSAEQKRQFLDAVKRGDVALNGAYLNELTALCRPAELLRLFRSATQFSTQTGVAVDAAMISDVPGYTWGTVTAMAQAGIKYFSAAPNNFDRIGQILREWENKPFYWVGPDGKSKVLVGIPFWGYALSHRYHYMSPRLVDEMCDSLARREYAYDIAYVRWSGHGDNGAPDPEICDFIKDWNNEYAWPKFIISGTSEAFRAFEQRHGNELPQVRGDWTPYWEDGAGSSARETAMNRANSDRLVQAESLFAMLDPKAYPAEAFAEAWRNVLLYSEHTWGADCSISLPESEKTKELWAVKKNYAVQADAQSRKLLQTALNPSTTVSSKVDSAVDVFNTLSWKRTELAILAPAFSTPGDRVIDAQGKPVPSQRLISGELVFLASEIPGFGAARFNVVAGAAVAPPKTLMARGSLLENDLIRVGVDEQTGGIIELRMKGLAGNFVDSASGESVNEYVYLSGDDIAGVKRNGPVTIRPGENGPLVASLIIESPAPGCKLLRREIRLVAGQEHVELINLVDKERLAALDYFAKEGKESVNFAFPFNIPDGRMLIDIPFGAMDPENGQLAGSCKNWFTVGRWIDVSNRERGVTWVPLDAPLVEVGGLTANLLNSQTNPDVWRQKVTRTQKFYSWAMNNHWGTNYRAYQDGPVTFRFVVRPHRHSSSAENTRFATSFSYPLAAVPTRGNVPSTTPRLYLDSSSLIVSSCKPSDDGKALIFRLFETAGKSATVMIDWSNAKPKSTWLSSTAEEQGSKLEGSISLPAWGVVTLRAELE